MAIGFEGAKGNEDMFRPPTLDPYTGEARLKRGLSTYGGMAAQLDPVTRQYTQGTDAWHASRYDDQASAARQGQLNYGNANAALDTGQQALSYAQQSRGQQQDVNNVMRDAAMGRAPSAAESLATGMANNTARQQLAAASSAKGGPLAQMVAQRNATQQIGAQGTQNMAQLGALRANEMANARQQWGGNVGMQRQQDVGTAGAAAQVGGTYAQMAQEQGRQNNQNSQFYDNLAHQVRSGQADRGLQNQQLEEQHWQYQTGVNQHAVDRDTNTLGSIIGGIAGAGAGILSDPAAKIPVEYGNGAGPLGGFLSSFGGKGFDMKMPGKSTVSDMRAKVPLTPEPSLRERGAAGLSNASQSLGRIGRQTEQGMSSPDKPMVIAGRGKAKAPPSWVSKYMEEQGTPASPGPVEAAENIDAPNIEREDPYGSVTPGDIQREDPYGSGEFFFSDPAAKQEAFQQGLEYGRRERMPREVQAPEKPAKSVNDGNRTQPRTVESGAPKVMERTMGAEGAGKVTTTPAPKGPLASLQQDANRSGAGFAYMYKPEYTPPEQASGELNWGPSADEMARNPLMATAVKRDPATGLKAIDANKLIKNNTAGIASLQQQLDELKGRRYG